MEQIVIDIILQREKGVKTNENWHGRIRKNGW